MEAAIDAEILARRISKMTKLKSLTIAIAEKRGRTQEEDRRGAEREGYHLHFTRVRGNEDCSERETARHTQREAGNTALKEE